MGSDQVRTIVDACLDLLLKFMPITLGMPMDPQLPPGYLEGLTRQSLVWTLLRPDCQSVLGPSKQGSTHHRLNPELTCLHLSLPYLVILIDADPYLECQKGQNRACTRFFTQGFVHIQVWTQLDLIPHLIRDGLIKKGPKTRPSC